MGQILETRRQETDSRVNHLRSQLGDAAHRAHDKACVYMTGSFARGEAGKHSDLDLFIVGKGDKNSRKLRRLDEICIKADLIQITRRNGIPEFSGDGQYLVHYTIDELITTLGKSDDDATNTFTARLLLLLESRPLIEESVYAEIIDQVMTSYWRDYEDNKTQFMPAFLANDILRLWRTFCVNYEARTAKEPEDKKAKRKLKNYKLKHSRLLTCYSALVYLLAIYRSAGTVSPDDCVEMVRLTPTGRIEALGQREVLPEPAKPIVADLLTKYEEFLSETDAAEDDLVSRFLDREKSRQLFQAANRFGDVVFELMNALRTDPDGNVNKFFRRLLV